MLCLDFLKLQHRSLLDKIGKQLAAAEFAAVGNSDVFIGDYAVERSVAAYDGILHDDGISNAGAFCDFDAAEQNGIFHPPFYFAAVGDQRIFDDGFFPVFRGALSRTFV